MTAVNGSISVCGPLGIRPNVDFSPNSPVHAAGFRIDPAPSEPNATPANPAAIALSDGKLGGAIPVDQRFDTTGALKGNPLQAVPISY